VLSGSLNEFRWDGRRLRRRRLDAGDQAGFRWLGARRGVGPRPAVIDGARPATLSVHRLLAAPDRGLSYYEVAEHDRLRRQRTELTDQPEGY